MRSHHPDTARWNGSSLPEGDDAKIAAVVVAAESWEKDRESLADNLAIELDVMQRTAKSLDDAEYSARRDAHHAEWANKSYRPHPSNRGAGPCTCGACRTPVSPWSCSCGKTRVGDAA